MRKQRAFTLIELVVVIAIIGILASLVAPRIRFYTQNAKNATIEANVRNILSGIHIDYLSYGKRPTQEQMNAIIQALNINHRHVSYTSSINANGIIIIEYKSETDRYAGKMGHVTKPQTHTDVDRNLNDGSPLDTVYFAYPIAMAE